ncbi:MAG: hypothetical protein KVP17_000348 [Porospora cf. gigantea B]|uniref:uncharacterized protein n=1 Tax=Porospora cf. gigantea B TaxID=2853592 RepID=UPI003571F46E|nr:MAG: hypothetical protein KVP17_000348 [Porospora cf. gigantea B]
MTLGATVIVFTQYDCRDFHGGCFQTYKMQDWVPAGTAMLAMINFTLYGLHKTVLLPATDHSKYYYLLSAVMVLFGVVCVGIAHTNMQYTIVWTQCVAGWAAWLGGIVSLSFQIPKVRRLVLSSIVHAVLLLTSAGFMVSLFPMPYAALQHCVLDRPYCRTLEVRILRVRGHSSVLHRGRVHYEDPTPSRRG